MKLDKKLYNLWAFSPELFIIIILNSVFGKRGAMVECFKMLDCGAEGWVVLIWIQPACKWKMISVNLAVKR